MSDTARTSQWLETANALANQGRMEEAIEAYQQALKGDPHNLDVRGYIIALSLKSGAWSEVIHQHMECAEIFRQQGDLDAAVDRYREVLRLEETVESQGSSLRPADEIAQVKESVKRVKPEVCLQIGRYFLLRGEVDQAVQYLRKSIELGPGRWEAHMELGKAYMQLGMDKEAIDQFQEVSRLAPQEAAQAYEMLGEIFARKKGRSVQNTKVWFQHAADMYVKKEQLKEATHAYLRILDLEPDNRDIMHALGDLYARQEKLAEAVETYRKLAGLYVDNKPLDKVINIYETVVSWDPHARWAIDQLIDIYESVLERNPTNINIRKRLVDHLLSVGKTDEVTPHYLQLANGNIERGMLDEAVKSLRRLLELDRGNIPARELLGEIYLKKDMQYEALETFQQIVKLYRAAGNEEAALKFQQRMVQFFPQAQDLVYQVAISLKDKNDLEGALQEIDRVIAQKPNDDKALIIKAQILTDLKQFDPAIHTYAKILQLDPQRVDIRKHVIDLLLRTNRLDESSRQISVLPADDDEVLELRVRLILLNMERRRLAHAEQELEALPADNEKRLLFRKELVKLYLDAGNLEKAFEGLPQIPRSDRERNSLVTRLLEIPLAKGDLQQAGETIHRLPEDDPLRLSFQRRLIASYLESGRLNEGSEEVARLPEEDESRSGFVSRLIGAFLAQGELEGAGREIYRLAEGDPLRNSYMGQLIEAYLSSGDIDRAAQEVGQLAEDDEIRPRYHRRIIQAYLNANRFEEAERDITALSADDPEKRSFLRLLIQKYLTLGQLDRVRDVVDLMPDDMEEKKQYLDGLVHNYLDSGDLARARQHIYSMAESASAQGDHVEAERLYREILAYQPADSEIRLRLSQEMAAQGQTERAREGMLVLAGRFNQERNVTSAVDVYSRMVDMDPTDYNARFKLGHLWAEQGQTAQALEQFATLARVYLDENLPEVAHKVLDRILELDPKDVEHRRQAIRLLIRNLRFEEATEHYRSLMSIHLERGEVDEAQDCVKEIINLQPLNLELRQSLGGLFLRAGFLEQGQGLLEELFRDAENKGEHERMLRILTELSDSFAHNEQWQTSLEYRDRMADMLVRLNRQLEATEQFYEVTKSYLLHSNVSEAARTLDKLVQGFVSSGELNAGLSRLEALESELESAERSRMAQIVKRKRAHLLEGLGRVEEAVELGQEMAMTLVAHNEIEEGLTAFRQAAERAQQAQLEEKSINILFELAGASIFHRGLEESRGILDELLTRTNGHPGHLERLGNVLFQQNLFEEARPFYRQVLDLEPGRPDALSRIAIIYAREGRLEEAADVAKQIFSKGLVSRIITEYKAATSFTKGEASSHIRLGQFFRQMGFLEEAIREFLLAAADKNKYLTATNCLAESFRQKGYHQLAVKQFQRALEQPGFRDEDFLELRFNLACTLEEMGQMQAALGAFQECYVIDIRYRDVASRIEVLMEKMQAAES